MTDHYATLGVAKNATPEDIKKAYRRLAAIHHPDKGGDTAEFQKVQAAYETLSDPQKKQQYDNPSPFGGHSGMHSGFPGGFEFHMNGFDMNDIFGHMFGGRPRNGRPQQPSYRTQVWVTLEQVLTGDELTLELQVGDTPHTVKIKTPQGIDNGQTMRFDNLIKDSILIIEFRIKPHPRFERNGADLFSVQEVSILDLIVGGSFKFKTISGKELDVTVKPYTQPGAQLRIHGEGLPMSFGNGDQYVLIKAVVPAIIDSSIIDAINKSK
jgi:DnaJ-class molecular chaperone